MKSFTTNRIVFAIGASVLGIILLIWPGTSLIIMAKCIGAAVAIGGLFAAYQFFRDHDSAVKSLLLVMAAVMIICGVVIFLHPEELVKLIPMIMGILVLLSGIINLGETFTLSRQRYNRWWLSLIIAVLTIGAGIFLITRAFSLAALITRIAGGILLFDGLSDLWVNAINKATGVAAIDIAKRLMDFGFHAPTVAFPVHETLMVEPTESEPIAELDRFVEAMIQIRKEIKDIEEGRAPQGDNIISHAPYTAEMLMANDWKFPFTREEAGFPMKSDVQDKYFPHVTRIDDAYGDRNLVCKFSAE